MKLIIHKQGKKITEVYSFYTQKKKSRQENLKLHLLVMFCGLMSKKSLKIIQQNTM